MGFYIQKVKGKLHTSLQLDWSLESNNQKSSNSS